jgi:parallel beta-helix repeat protein
MRLFDKFSSQMWKKIVQKKKILFSILFFSLLCSAISSVFVRTDLAIVSSSGYRDSMGWFNGMGEVVNNGDSTASALVTTAQPIQGDWITTGVEMVGSETTSGSLSPTIKLIGQIGGATQTVAVQDNYAYVGVGLRLVVLDVSNPNSPREVGATEPLAGFIKDITIAGNTTYVVDGVGLWVVDVSNPAHPNEVGFYNTPGYAEGVTVSGQYAYVADGWAGLRVLNISDRAHPTEIGFVYTLGYAFEVDVAEGMAYVAGAGAGLRVVDISNPADPTEVGFYDTSGYARDVTVADDIAYIADEWEGLRVVDVSEPANPIEIGWHTTPGQAFGVAVEGDTAYVADAFKGLRIIDISSPSSPEELGAYEVKGHAGKVVVEDRAYIADRNNGLRIIDVSNRSSPTQVSFYSGFEYADAVTVSGNYAYIAAGSNGLRVVDISNPARPRQVGQYDCQSYATGAAMDGNYVYIPTEFSFGESGASLHIFDVSNPREPFRVASCTEVINPEYWDIVVSEGVAYVANGWGMVVILNPNDPSEAGHITLTQDIGIMANGLDVSGTLAYVAVNELGIKIVDVSNPQELTLTGTFASESFFAQDVTVVGNRAYVAAGKGGLVVLNVSNPAHPLEMGSFETQGGGVHVAVDGDVAYVAAGKGGVSAVDISDPFNLSLITRYDTPGYAHEVVVKDNLLYVSDGTTGLLVFEIVTSNVLNNYTFSRFEESPTNYPQIVESNLFSRSSRITVSEPAGGLSSLAANIPNNIASNTLVVTTTADSGEGSFRRCIKNAQYGDTISFDSSVFPPDNSATISLDTPLPSITQGNITIDGSNAGVILDGDSACIEIHSDGNVLKGLQILNFPGTGVTVAGNGNIIGGDRGEGKGPVGQGNVISGGGGSGIVISGDNNIVVGNLIGTDVSGKEVLSNKDLGIHLLGKNNRIGGIEPWQRNIISGNGYAGISPHYEGSNGNSIIGNYIGTDISGSYDLGNSGDGIAIEQGAFNNLVKGNLISGNGGAGVTIWDWSSSYNTVIGNIIGLDASGTKALGNGCGVGVGGRAEFNRIGGMTAEERNVISGNNEGVALVGPGPNVVLGNFIGTDVTGTRALGNAGAGVTVQDTCSFVGGITEGERNVISGNGIGVKLFSLGIEYNWIAGNYIGTDASGTVALGNTDFGVTMNDGATHNVFQGNLISGNLEGGVSIQGDSGNANFNLLWANHIGTAADGVSPLPNSGDGLCIEASSNTAVGNVIAYNRDYGIRIRDVGGNLVFHNDLINNRVQAADSGSNQWDYNCEGNYWSDYTGVDGDGDGICDTPYHIHLNARDNYPFMNRVVETIVFFRPVTAPRPARFTFTDLSISPAEVNVGETTIVSVRVTNIGEQEGSYMVELKINNEAVDNEEVTLKAGESTSVDFTVIEEAGTYDVDIEGQTGTLVVIPVVEVFDINWNATNYPVAINSNSTVTNFNFNQTESEIKFDVTGSPDTTGYCNVTLPNSLLWGYFTVYVDGTEVPYMKTTNGTHTFLFFTYEHSTKMVQIQATEVIPEFSSCLLLSLFLTLTLMVAVITRRTVE